MSEVNTQDKEQTDLVEENKNPIPPPVIPSEEEDKAPPPVKNQDRTLGESSEEVKGFLQPIIDGLSDLKKSELYDSILQMLLTANRGVKSNISGVIDLFASKGIETEKFTVEEWNELAEKIIKTVHTEKYDRLSSAIEGILHQGADKKTKLSLWSSAIDSFFAELAD
ncbi:hypothetical protein [Leptospira interrogans]|uniref:hypothetical protein n=1 Tax=Leptospira interrogans TaxID=173 RepID=UPI0002BABF80|nr:hypothetical protein [Leptospira interrogans]